MSSERDAAFLSSGMHPLLCFGSTWFVRGRDKCVFFLTSFFLFSFWFRYTPLFFAVSLCIS